jgi:general secretion pathway protein G
MVSNRWFETSRFPHEKQTDWNGFLGRVAMRPECRKTVRDAMPNREHLPALRSRGGFTLIEILVVVTVLAILAALVGPSVFRHLSTAKNSAASSQMEMLGAALDAYRLDNGRYPTTAQGLEALRTKPTAEPLPRNWQGPYLRKAVPLDPWGYPYSYTSPGEYNPSGYDLQSFGADGAPGGEGDDADIRAWE